MFSPDLAWVDAKLSSQETHPSLSIYPKPDLFLHVVQHSVAGRAGYRSTHTVNPALLASSFVWQIQLSLLHISLFKVIKRKYISQGKCEFVKFLFVLLDKIEILTL
jgi:hypothetical protein